MRLKCINMVTNDVVRLRDFYCMALRAEYDESHGAVPGIDEPPRPL